MKLRINPLKNSNNSPMPFTDAAIVAFILTAASFFTVYYPTLTFTGVLSNLAETVFYAVGYVGGQFFTNFLTLTGLSRYFVSKEGKKN